MLPRRSARERHITVGKRSSLHNLLEAGANINNLARGELAPENTLDYLSRLADSTRASAAPQPREKPQLLYILCVLLLIEIINLALTTNWCLSHSCVFIYIFHKQRRSACFNQSLINWLTDWFLFLLQHVVFGIFGQARFIFASCWCGRIHTSSSCSLDRFLRRKLTCERCSLCARPILCACQRFFLRLEGPQLLFLMCCITWAVIRRRFASVLCVRCCETIIRTARKFALGLLLSLLKIWQSIIASSDCRVFRCRVDEGVKT